MSFSPLSIIDLAQPGIHVHYLFVYSSLYDSFDKTIEILSSSLLKLEKQYPLLSSIITKKDNKIGLQYNSDTHIDIYKQENYKKSLEECGFLKDNKSILHSHKWPMDLIIPREKLISKPLGICITQFTCGGISIGVSFHHQVFDGYGASQILVSWSNIINNTNHTDNIYDFNRENIFNSVKELGNSLSISNTEFLSISLLNPPKSHSNLQSLVKSTVQYIRWNYDELTNLKNELNEELLKDNISQKLSLNDIICGLIWYFFVISNPNKQEKYDLSLLFAVDTRIRLSDIIPTDYCGNCAILHKAEYKCNEKDQILLKNLCLSIRKQLLSFNSTYIGNKILWIEDELKKGNMLLPNWRMQTPTGFPDLLLSSWFKFPFYNINLTKEQPIYAGVAPSQGMSGIGILQPLLNSKDICLVMSIPDILMNNIKSLELYKKLIR